MVKAQGALISLIFLASILMISAGQHAKSQFNESFCMGKYDEMVSRATDWMSDWDTAEIDPNGKIRDDGKQLTSEIGLTLVNCESFLNADDMLVLTEVMDVINASIDNNINYGPPCDPFCEPGPRIVSR